MANVPAGQSFGWNMSGGFGLVGAAGAETGAGAGSPR